MADFYDRSIKAEFDKSRKNSEKDDLPLTTPNGDWETSIGTDIKGFFEVLLTFIKGLYNRDMADFNTLSAVYFPPEKETGENSDLYGRLRKMSQVGDDPNHPDRSKSEKQLHDEYSEGLPQPQNLVASVPVPPKAGM